MNERSGHPTPSEWRVILVLEKFPNGITKDELAAELARDITVAHLSVLLRRIVRKGYASCEPLSPKQTGRPPFLFRPVGAREALRSKMAEFLRTYVTTAELLQDLLEEVEEHRRTLVGRGAQD